MLMKHWILIALVLPMALYLSGIVASFVAGYCYAFIFDDKGGSWLKKIEGKLTDIFYTVKQHQCADKRKHNDDRMKLMFFTAFYHDRDMLSPVGGGAWVVGILGIFCAIITFLMFRAPALGISIVGFLGVIYLMRCIVRGGKKAMTKHVKELHEDNS